MPGIKSVAGDVSSGLYTPSSPESQSSGTGPVRPTGGA